MDLSILKEIENAPKSGTYLIYTRKEVLFDHYDKIDAVKEILENQEILEMHLFNKDKEYRMIKTESKRFKNQIIEHVVDKQESTDSFIDRTRIDGDEINTLNIINYIVYDDESGMLKINDYRLTMGGNE